MFLEVIVNTQDMQRQAEKHPDRNPIEFLQNIEPIPMLDPNVDYSTVRQVRIKDIKRLPGLKAMTEKFNAETQRNPGMPPAIYIPEFLKEAHNLYGITYLIEFANKDWVVKSHHSKENEFSGRSSNYDPQDAFNSFCDIVVSYDNSR